MSDFQTGNIKPFWKQLREVSGPRGLCQAANFYCLNLPVQQVTEGSEGEDSEETRIEREDEINL